MLESDGTVLKDIIPDQIDVSEKKGILHILGGPEQGKKYDISGNAGTEIRVGRDEINDIIAKGEGVSRYHSKFVISADGKVNLVDLDSKNGTFVGGKKIKEKILSGGDRILFGDVPCKYESMTGGAFAGKKPIMIAAAAVLIFIILLAMFSGGKPEKATVIQQVQITEKPFEKVVDKKEEKNESRLEQKISIAERECDIGNYDDALDIARSVLKKNPSFKPALKLVKRVKIKRQEVVDKEILKMGKSSFAKNDFYDAKSQLEQIEKTSRYYREAKKYLDQTEKIPAAEKKYKDALVLWKKGKIEEVLEKIDLALDAVPEYKKPIPLKEKALKVKGLLDKLETAESEGEIKKTEKLASEIQGIVKDKNNAIYKNISKKISKITFGKFYKANRFYVSGMRQIAEGRFSNALDNFEKARQLVPKRKTYDHRYKETMQKLGGRMMKMFFAAYVLEEKDPTRSKNLLQKILKLGIETDPYYQKALRKLGD